MMPTAEHWIEQLQLATHVEGGSFREVYRSALQLPKALLPNDFKGDRNASTSIYFLLQQGQFSAFHRIASDEQWHFYYGGTLVIYEIKMDGQLVEHRLGNDPNVAGTSFQCVISAGSWFASRPDQGVPYCLAGCTVSPGFDFDDFELAQREDLAKAFPQHRELVEQLTR